MIMIPHTLIHSVGSVTIDSGPPGKVGTGSPRGMRILGAHTTEHRLVLFLEREVLQLA